MSKFFTLANLKRQSIPKKKGVKVPVIMGTMTLFLLALYLFNVNGLTEAGYRLKLLQEQASTLKHEQELFSNQLAASSAITKIHGRLETLPFEKIASLEYLSPKSKNVAYGERYPKILPSP